jgi:hypothetical protein
MAVAHAEGFATTVLETSDSAAYLSVSRITFDISIPSRSKKGNVQSILSFTDYIELAEASFFEGVLIKTLCGTASTFVSVFPGSY